MSNSFLDGVQANYLTDRMIGIPGMDSSLTPKDGAKLLKRMFDHHKQTDFEILKAFSLFFLDIAVAMNDKMDDNWANQMEDAALMFKTCLNVLPASGDFTKDVEIATGCIALSIAVDHSPNLFFFAKNATEILKNEEFTFNPTEERIPTLSALMSSVFIFWVAYDQLSCRVETKRQVMESFLEGFKKLNEEKPVVARWFGYLTNEKFNDTVCTVIRPTELLVIKSDD